MDIDVLCIIFASYVPRIVYVIMSNNMALDVDCALDESIAAMRQPTSEKDMSSSSPEGSEQVPSGASAAAPLPQPEERVITAGQSTCVWRLLSGETYRNKPRSQRNMFRTCSTTTEEQKSAISGRHLSWTVDFSIVFLLC